MQKELLLAELLSQRFTTGSLEQRMAAEEAYARRLADLGEQYADASLLAMAGESLTHVTSWDYYEVRPNIRSHGLTGAAWGSGTGTPPCWPWLGRA